MKGAAGLIVAVFLGLLGVMLNWVYLENKTKDVDSVSFIGIRDGVTIRPGERLEPKHFDEVKVPKRHAKNLADFVYLYEDRNTVAGISATRQYHGGELLHRADYRTPPAELKLAKGEMVFWVPVDSRFFVPELVNPGDKISFRVPVYSRSVLRTPADASESGAVGNAPTPAAAGIETYGPFRVGSLGNRLGSPEVMRAGQRSAVQERQIGIVINTTDKEEMEEFDRLQERVLTGDYRNIAIALHPRE